MNLIRRGSTFHIRRRVPKRFARVEPRPYVWITLKTDCESEAGRRAAVTWKALIAGWEARLASRSADAEARLQAAKVQASRLGFAFPPARDVARLHLEELLRRIEATIDKRTGKIDPLRATALLGTSAYNISVQMERYWSWTADRERGKSPDQIRRMRNRRLRAVRNFIDVCGDLRITEMNQGHVSEFRHWWAGKIKREGLRKCTANAEFAYLAATFEVLQRSQGLGLRNPFRGMKFLGEHKNHRAPFPTEFLRDVFLRPGALDGLNLEARCILLGMVNTGYRPSEGAALTRARIRLDAEIPHISIEPDQRRLKNHYSQRIIPLAGVSLEAFRACPDGFPRYADSPTLSNLVNRYLRHHKLVPSPEHTMYGLRHSFSDRLLQAGVDKQTQRELMGHRRVQEWERINRLAHLDRKYAAILQIAL